MIEYYITELQKWLDNVLPAVFNEKYFLWIIGSIFLMGVVTKCIVVSNYDRLIKKAEHMTNPKNATLRQIKMKFESVKQVNGAVANPMLLVTRHINKCKVGIFYLNKLDNIINLSIFLIIGISAIMGYEQYREGKKEIVVIAYVAIGCYVAFVLEMISRCIKVKERQTELAYVIVDFLENNALYREERYMGLETDEKICEAEADKEKEEDKYLQEEQILNQVIGEFLQ